MRKDKKFGKNIRLFSSFRIKGVNADYLINKCVKRGITLFGVKKISDRETEISVKYGDRKKFFAITEDLCYNNKNVVKIKEKGLLYPVFYLLKNFGLIIGALLFCLTSYFYNDLVLKIEFTGSGSVFKEEVRELLSEEGVDKYSRFSNINLKLLEDKIVSRCDDLSFVGLEKIGNTLLLRLEPSNSKLDIREKKSELISDVTGVIESIKVYRGTAVKKVGDTVNVGELIVAGQMTVKEVSVNTGVVASVSVISEKEFTYISKLNNEEEKAEMMALGNFNGEEVLEIKTEKINLGEEFKYVTTVNFRHYIYSY